MNRDTKHAIADLEASNNKPTQRLKTQKEPQKSEAVVTELIPQQAVENVKS